jgi:hypothetical protein
MKTEAAPRTPPRASRPCSHLLAPLQEDEASAVLLVFRNWRKCARCGEPLWDDGSPMAYLGTGRVEGGV